MKNLIELLKNWGVFIFVFFLILFASWVHYGVWNECRSTNSFLYCMTVLGK